MTAFEVGKCYPDRYSELFNEKLQLTKKEFEELFDGDIQAFPSSSKHFRMRAEFRIWHNDHGAHYAMYEQGKYKEPVIISEFPIGAQKITELMPALLSSINAIPQLSRKLFQVEFLTTTTGQALITLIYHKALDEEWLKCAKSLEDQLGAFIIGRSRKQKEVISQDFVTEHLDLSVGKISYKQIETGFTQPNAGICKDMLNWAGAHARDLGGDLLELYCGNGNFTIPLSFFFNQVLATEVSKLSTRSALDNITDNKRSNIKLVRLSAEEVSQAFSGVRAFRRLKDIDLDSYQFTTVFVDPPRAGIDDTTLEFISRFDNIIYISCNPITLKENLNVLSSTHDIKHFSFFDQFPYTHHRECGVLLKRKK